MCTYLCSVNITKKKEAYNVSNHVLRSIYTYIHANQLHINLSNCAHMYFRTNFNYIERMKCARSHTHPISKWSESQTS